VSICETTAEPGRLIPPHLHDTEDEFSYVIEGRIGVLIGDDEYLAEAGSWVVKPRGIPHTYWNPGPRRARLKARPPPHRHLLVAGLAQAISRAKHDRGLGGPVEASSLGRC
jgi:quercetin dioxygenase-like cupin family protein